MLEVQHYQLLDLAEPVHLSGFVLSSLKCKLGKPCLLQGRASPEGWNVTVFHKGLYVEG